MRSLRELYLNNNELTALPTSFAHLQNIQELHLENNQLDAVPESLGELHNLRELHIQNNELKDVSESIGKLPNLQIFNLSTHHLPDAMREVYNRGTTKQFLAYLTELASAKGDERLYETKLVMVGEGDVGKSCHGFELR